MIQLKIFLTIIFSDKTLRNYYRGPLNRKQNAQQKTTNKQTTGFKKFLYTLKQVLSITHMYDTQQISSSIPHSSLVNPRSVA